MDGIGPAQPAADDGDDEATARGADATSAPSGATQADGFPVFAHDLNTLLGIILSYATLLSHEAGDPAAAADLGEIRDATRRAIELTKQFAARPRR